jgi:nitroreductase
VTDKNVKEKLQAASWNQEQITTCSHLLVFCADTDLISKKNALEKGLIEAGAPKDELKKYISMIDESLASMSKDKQLAWAQKQVYLAVANALNGAKSLGFDSCPMEGFDAKEYSKILSLDDNIIPTVVVPIGYAADTAKPKFRFSKEEVFF